MTRSLLFLSALVAPSSMVDLSSGGPDIYAIIRVPLRAVGLAGVPVARAAEILLMCDDFKVRRVGADAIPAEMVDNKAVRDAAVVNLP